MRFLRTENTKILDVWFVKNEKGLRVVVFQNISDKNMKCVKSMKIMSRKCENGLVRYKKPAQTSAYLGRFSCDCQSLLHQTPERKRLFRGESRLYPFPNQHFDWSRNVLMRNSNPLCQGRLLGTPNINPSPFIRMRHNRSEHMHRPFGSGDFEVVGCSRSVHSDNVIPPSPAWRTPKSPLGR